MRIVRQVLTGVISVVFLVGGVTMMTPFGSEAEAAPKTKKDDSNHTRSWDRILDSTDGEPDGCNSSRFKCIMNTGTKETPNYEAVLDLETGLVWDRVPDDTSRDWASAISHCALREVGGRKGWELPMRNQLASLVDSSNSSPALPTDHPFDPVDPAAAQSSFYWSATTRADFPAGAWAVDFNDGDLGTGGKAASSEFVWCVRGGQSFAGNTHSTLH